MNKDVKKVFDKIHDELTARQITDQAISYRNLKQYDKAISLLKKVINEYHYPPAKSILGNTLVAKGDIDSAEAHFKKMLSDCIKGDDYPLIEIYANLGSLYHNYKKDNQTALKYYELALNATKPDNIDEEKYKIMTANVYRDLIILHSREEKWEFVKKYALLRLNNIKDCPIASVAYGVCLIQEYDSIVYNYKRSPLENEDKSELLLDALNYFNKTLSKYPNNYPALSGVAVASYHLRILYALYSQFPDKAFSNFGITEEVANSTIKSLKEIEFSILDTLSKFSKESQDAKSCLEFYQSQVAEVESFLGLRK